MTWFNFRGRAGVAFLAVVASLSLPPSTFAEDKEKNPDEIGNRDVGKGVNFYSLDKEIALGKQLAQGSSGSPRSLTIRLLPSTSTGWDRTWSATPTPKFPSRSR